MKPTKQITFIHLLNDYSGSPLVLSNVIRGLKDKGFDCKIITSGNGEGFLSGIEDAGYHHFNYRFVENKLLRLFVFFWTQLILFYKVWSLRKNNDLIYINTLLPFAAALAGKWSGQKVIYHIHETSLKPTVLKNFLRWIAGMTASQSIFVSKFLAETEQLKNVPSTTVYNALSNHFKDKADSYLSKRIASETFGVLMLCSLKAYKGIHEFVKLSKRLPQVQFQMVLNAKQKDIDQVFKPDQIPANLKLYPSQNNVHPFYQNAKLILNLSHPQEWVETFGMTLLEGMYYGLPCIAPPVGGPAEIVENEINGYCIDQRDLDAVQHRIAALAIDSKTYQRLSSNAIKRAKSFNYNLLTTEIETILNNSLTNNYLHSKEQFNKY